MTTAALIEQIRKALEPFGPGKIIRYDHKTRDVTISYEQMMALSKAAFEINTLEANVKEMKEGVNEALALLKEARDRDIAMLQDLKSGRIRIIRAEEH